MGEWYFGALRRHVFYKSLLLCNSLILSSKLNNGVHYQFIQERSCGVFCFPLVYLYIILLKEVALHVWVSAFPASLL